MEEKLARRLLQLFFQAPLVNALLVFEDSDYLGIVFKKDIERGVTSGDFELFENISTISVDQLPAALFGGRATKSAMIPVIDKAGETIGIISYDEFLSQLMFEKYIFRFDLEPVLDNLDHPVLITNTFKKILYLNKEALTLFQKDMAGKAFGAAIKDFEMEMRGEQMIVSRGDEMFRLFISQSPMKNFSFIFYQFFYI